MNLLVTLLLLGADSPATGAPIPPATALAIDIAEAVGARIAKLTVQGDASIVEDELALLRTALGRTGLFALVDPDQAQALVMVTRVDPAVVLASVSRPDGSRLWVGRSHWPRLDEPAVVPGNEDDRQAARLRYRRESLRTAPVVRGVAMPPMMQGGFGARWFGDPRPWGWRFDAAVPTSDAPTDWVIMRGTAETLDERAFAELLGNPALIARIDDAQFWPQLYWALGFGGGALAGAGTGAFLLSSHDRDQRALGMSLVTVGAISALLAIMFPAAGPHHVMSVNEVEARIDDYNEVLRRRYGLSPSEVEPRRD